MLYIYNIQNIYKIQYIYIYILNKILFDKGHKYEWFVYNIIYIYIMIDLLKLICNISYVIFDTWCIIFSIIYNFLTIYNIYVCHKINMYIYIWYMCIMCNVYLSIIYIYISLIKSKNIFLGISIFFNTSYIIHMIYDIDLTFQI